MLRAVVEVDESLASLIREALTLNGLDNPSDGDVTAAVQHYAQLGAAYDVRLTKEDAHE